MALTTSSKFLWHLLHLPISFFSQRYAGELSPRIGSNDRVATLLAEELATQGFCFLWFDIFEKLHHISSKDMKEAKEKESPGTMVGKELRIRCNKLTDEQRQQNMVKAIRLVYGEEAI